MTVVREDVNGTKASATYTPTVLPVTTFVDENGKEIPGFPTEDGEQPKKDIPGYEFVKTVVDANGNTQHIYKQVVTRAPETPSTPETKEVAFINPTDEKAVLPKTGTEESSKTGLAILSALTGLSLFGLAKRKKED